MIDRKTIALLLIISILIVSCGPSRKEIYQKSGYGVASWYGSDFHGKPTSSGELYNMYAFTCAHNEFPFGTNLKVTNITNNKAVYCMVNDRGPFVPGRDIDLSYAAAKEIGLVEAGTERVWIEHVGRDTSYIKEARYTSESGPFTIQVGSFIEKTNAKRLKKALEMKYDNVYITDTEIDGQKFYRVRIGKFSIKKDVDRYSKILAQEGYSILITKYEESI